MFLLNVPSCFKSYKKNLKNRLCWPTPQKQENGRTFNGSSVADVVFSLPLGVWTLWIHAGDTDGVSMRRQKSYLTLHTRTPHDE